MEHRDRTRIVVPSLDDDESEVSPRRARFQIARAAGRLDLRKVAIASVLVPLVLIAVFFAGGRFLQWAVDMLHRQPRYQLPFNRIELTEAPPPSFRGGAETFLDRVRRTADEPEVLSILDVDPERLASSFKQFPWVEDVKSIDFPPRSIVVRLAYRNPVAMLRIGPTDQFIVDRSGVILPLDDLDLERVRNLPWITGTGLVAPKRDRVGKLWSTTASGDASESSTNDQRVIEAAALAGFLRDREAETAPDLNFRTYAVHVIDSRGLFVQTSDGVLILWGRGPGSEAPGEVSASEKWGMLVKQAKDGGLKLEGAKDYWSFGRNELKHVRIPSSTAKAQQRSP